MPAHRRKVLNLAFGAIPSPTSLSVTFTNSLRALGRRYVVDALVLKDEEQAHVERYHGARLLRVPAAGEGLRERADSLRRAVIRQIESDDYELVHFRSAWEGLPAIQRAGDFGFRTILELSTLASLEIADHDAGAANDRAYAQELFEEEDECLRSADLVLVRSRVVRDQLRARGRRARVEYVPPGVDVDRFDWQPAQDTGKPVILYMGSLRPDRGVAALIEAAAEVLRYREARFVLVGRGDEQRIEGIKQLARACGVTDSVQVRREVPHELVPDLIATAAACVAPYSGVASNVGHGAAPMKVLEAMACRRPVIATRIPRVEEVVADGVDGLLVPPDEVDELAGAIEQVLEDRTLATRLAEAGYRKVRDNFTASAARRRVLETYARVFGGREVRWDGDVAPDPVDLVVATGMTVHTGGGSASGPSDVRSTPGSEPSDAAITGVHANLIVEAAARAAEQVRSGEISREIVLQARADTPVRAMAPSAAAHEAEGEADRSPTPAEGLPHIDERPLKREDTLPQIVLPEYREQAGKDGAGAQPAAGARSEGAAASDASDTRDGEDTGDAEETASVPPERVANAGGSPADSPRGAATAGDEAAARTPGGATNPLIGPLSSTIRPMVPGPVTLPPPFATLPPSNPFVPATTPLPEPLIGPRPPGPPPPLRPPATGQYVSGPEADRAAANARAAADAWASQSSKRTLLGQVPPPPLPGVLPLGGTPTARARRSPSQPPAAPGAGGVAPHPPASGAGAPGPSAAPPASLAPPSSGASPGPIPPPPPVSLQSPPAPSPAGASSSSGPQPSNPPPPSETAAGSGTGTDNPAG